MNFSFYIKSQGFWEKYYFILLWLYLSKSKAIKIGRSGGVSELISYNTFGKFFDQVLGLDESIRFVAIHDGSFKAKYQNGVEGYFKEEEIKLSLSEAHNRWDSRKMLSFRIGEPKFAMAQYGKINRITIPLGSEGIILVTTELDADIERIVEGIIYARSKFFQTK